MRENLGGRMPRSNDLPAATVVINRFDSYCNNCGIDCSFFEKTHDTNLGYSKDIRDTPGCGIEWKFVASDYIGLEVDKCRPDLEYISRWV